MDKQALTTLLQTLKTDIRVAEQLLTTLEVERKALTAHNLAQFEAATEHKSKLVKEMQATQETRDALQQEHGYMKGFVGLKDFIDNIPQPIPKLLRNAFNNLEDLLHKIEKQTLINTKAIMVSQLQVSKVLTTFLGEPEQNSTYDSDAKTHNTSTNIITKA